ncbi:hypothetical protein NLO86_27565, partial [Pseudomonas savastanoi]|uniref:hypothetical protein n=1 Tax=Pseudomonas savastanoi TaxID=29438 RepID=UPI00210CB5C8
GLLALAGILGVGEGHLFHHRKARRLVSGDFAKLGSLFQSFPNNPYRFAITDYWTSRHSDRSHYLTVAGTANIQTRLAVGPANVT